jgi:hypothetical protein
MKNSKTEPIEPRFESVIDEAIRYINLMLTKKEFTDRLMKSDDDDWLAIILSPYGRFPPIMDEVVERFKLKGFECSWNSEYDARGPWHSFLVHKKHFMGVGVSISCSPYGLGETFYNSVII